MNKIQLLDFKGNEFKNIYIYTVTTVYSMSTVGLK